MLTPGPKGMGGAIAKANQLIEDHGGCLCLNNSANANPAIHRKTRPRIWSAMEGRVDCFVAGVGTGGTITGVSK